MVNISQKNKRGLFAILAVTGLALLVGENKFFKNGENEGKKVLKKTEVPSRKLCVEPNVRDDDFVGVIFDLNSISELRNMIKLIDDGIAYLDERDRLSDKPEEKFYNNIMRENALKQRAEYERRLKELQDAQRQKTGGRQGR